MRICAKVSPLLQKLLRRTSTCLPSSSPSTLRLLTPLHPPKTLNPPTFFPHSPHFLLFQFSSDCPSGDRLGDDGDGWDDDEDNDEVEPRIGDGGDGGGIALRGVEWGDRSLSVAREVLRLHFGEDFSIFSFKTSPRGYVYVRLDKLSSEYGCPSMEELENFSCLYKQQLDEIGERGEIPMDLALEVSSPGAERLLKVPDDLDRFKEMPMAVCYMEQNAASNNSQPKEGVFMLDFIEMESGYCMWKLADVKENRDESAKGRPLSRKQKDWRLKLRFEMTKRVTLYLHLS